jgi:hypothetical protein
VIALFFTTSLINAHIVYEVKQQKGRPARAELWVAGGRAHLKLPEREIFWDLVHERRVELAGGRSRDQPIAFERMVQSDELFPRGWKLPRHGHKRVLGKTCDILTHQQDVPRGDGSVKARFTWCVWRGLPLMLEYRETVCRRRRCKHGVARWKAVQLTPGAARDSDVQR